MAGLMATFSLSRRRGAYETSSRPGAHRVSENSLISKFTVLTGANFGYVVNGSAVDH